MDLRCSRLSSDSSLALTSFVAARHPTESCGTNGLPLTPNSIAILGQSQRLRLLAHDRLCLHLECIRGKHERIVAVSSWYKDSLASSDEATVRDLERVGRQVLEGLAYLHGHGVVHATLEPSKVLFDAEGDVKLFNFGLGHLTNYGAYVAFPIFDPRFAAPEVIAAGPVSLLESSSRGSDSGASADQGDAVEATNKEFEDLESLTQIPEEPVPRYNPNCDVWSLGMVLACSALDLHSPWSNLKLSQVMRKVLSLRDYQGNVLDRIARECDRVEKAKEINASVRDLIEACLVPDPGKRPSAHDLLTDKFSLSPEIDDLTSNMFTFPSLRLKCRDFEAVLNGSENDGGGGGDEEDEEEPLDVLSIQETYYLWKLAGGDVLSELGKHGLMVTRPPVLSLPRLVLGEGHLEGQLKERSSLYDPVVIALSLEQLRSCLSEISTDDCYPLLLENGDAGKDTDDQQDETASLPLVIKEGDVRYQFKRVVLYRRLLQCYPFQKSRIWTEARVDSLPLYRSFIWASLLGIEHDTVARYEAVDKETWTPTDRQIEVDIPRCHQYSSLLASPEGHRKFKRVLKAWVATNPQYVYWQGLDSLCAPFLYLNFNDEALAFACLSAFIPKYLHGMFQRDNAAVIQEYLAKLRHIQAFHDPELFNHLDGIGFIPDLYAIPWILTMFAHVFPLQNIFHLWDKLLLGDSSFPLCIGLSILSQLRDRLLQAEFNDCILLFSDLPAVDIEKCVKDSVHVFCTTPKSLTWRKYDRPRANKGRKDLGIDSITLEQQKMEKVPRMSGEELLYLLGVENRGRWSSGDDGLSTPSSQYQAVKSLVLVLDVRPLEERKLGALPRSVAVPGAVEDAEAAVARLLPDLAEMKRGKVLCVAGSRAEERAAIAFAERLLEAGQSRVCLLHGGVDIFKTMKEVLIVPDA